MRSPVEQMLFSLLSQQANYAEKQLLKSGELGTCAAGLIKRRRRALRICYSLFFAFLVIPVAIQFAAWIFSPERVTDWRSFSQSGLLAMTQLPAIVLQQASLSKLETIVTLWLLSGDDTRSHSVGNADLELSELLADNL